MTSSPGWSVGNRSRRLEFIGIICRRIDAGTAQERTGLIEDAAFGKGKDNRHGGGLPSRRRPVEQERETDFGGGQTRRFPPWQPSARHPISRLIPET